MHLFSSITDTSENWLTGEWYNKWNDKEKCLWWGGGCLSRWSWTSCFEVRGRQHCWVKSRGHRRVSMGTWLANSSWCLAVDGGMSRLANLSSTVAGAIDSEQTAQASLAFLVTGAYPDTKLTCCFYSKHLSWMRFTPSNCPNFAQKMNEVLTHGYSYGWHPPSLTNKIHLRQKGYSKYCPEMAALGLEESNRFTLHVHIKLGVTLSVPSALQKMSTSSCPAQLASSGGESDLQRSQDSSTRWPLAFSSQRHL